MSQDALLTVSPADRPCQVTPYELDDVLSGTKQTITFAQPVAVSSLVFKKIGASANATVAYVVFNAVGSADADAGLAKAGTQAQRRFCIFLGDPPHTFPFGPDAVCTRIDVISNAASETAGSTRLCVEAGVLL